MQKALLAAAVLSLASTVAWAQDPQTTFRKAYQTNDTATMRLTLLRWRQQEPRNANVYVARASYWQRQAEQAGRKTAAPTGKVRALTTTQLSETAQNDPCQALALAPDRLDVHFALAKAYEKQGDARQQLFALRQALQAHGQSGLPWRWYDSAELPAAEGEFVPASLDEFATYYWQQGDAAALAVGKQLAELITEYYPESYLGAYNLSQYYGGLGQHEQAREQLLRAYKLQPKEIATLVALVKTELALGHKPAAQQYVAQLRKLPEAREMAAELSQQIKEAK